MRRLSWLAGSLILSLGCSGDAFNAHPDMVAEAAGQQLSAERVAEILSSVKGFTATPDAANFIANLWVDYTLVAQAEASNTLAADSATAAHAMWPEVAQITAGHWFDSLISNRVSASPEKLDSVYQLDSLRVSQHVLITLPPTPTEADRRAARREIDNVLARARSGANFGDLALRFSKEPAAQADSGFLPPAPRGAFVPTFDSVAWRLAPGEISDVVVTQFGFHVVRRASEEQAKARLASVIMPPLVDAMEKAYYAELDSIYQPEQTRNAVAKARGAIDNLARAARDNTKLVNFSDGTAFTLADFAKWIQADLSNPAGAAERLKLMKELPDSNYQMALDEMAGRFLFLREAQRSGASLTADEWQEVQEAFANQVDTVKRAIGLGSDVLDPAASESARRAAAAIRVDDFFDRMISGEQNLRPLPGMLTWTLRAKADARVNPAGVQHAVALAQARTAAAGDSGAAPQPVLTPAPGGPPVPGQ